MMTIHYRKNKLNIKVIVNLFSINNKLLICNVFKYKHQCLLSMEDKLKCLVIGNNNNKSIIIMKEMRVSYNIISLKNDY